jgi:predicted nucleic acid-binding protein
MHVVDTNVISEMMKSRPSLRVGNALKLLDGLSVSVVSIDEITYGWVHTPRPALERAFDAFLDRCVVLPVTKAIARRSGTMRALQRARGRVRHQADMLIAATAAEHGAVLVTRNVRDFEGCGIRVLDPFG